LQVVVEGVVCAVRAVVVGQSPSVWLRAGDDVVGNGAIAVLWRSALAPCPPAIRVRGIVLHARKVAQRCSLGWEVREGRVANDGVVGVLSLGVTRDELGDVPDGRELRELSGYVGVVVRGTFLRGVYCVGNGSIVAGVVQRR